MLHPRSQLIVSLTKRNLKIAMIASPRSLHCHLKSLRILHSRARLLSAVSPSHPQPLVMSFPARVRVVEVGPRDGLQNEKSVIVPTEVKVELITRLKAAGLTSIEAGSFVRADWVPQMADTPQVLRSLRNAGKVDLKEDVTVLTPNAKGLVGALDAGVGEVAVFGAASESFSQKNINASIDKSLANFEIVAKEAIKNGDLVL